MRLFKKYWKILIKQSSRLKSNILYSYFRVTPNSSRHHLYR